MGGLAARLVATLAVLLVLAGCASRDPRRDPTLKLPKFAEFDAADTDHSGKLSRDEAAALPFVARYFDEIDTDHNGEASWQEVTHLDLRAARRNQVVPAGP